MPFLLLAWGEQKVKKWQGQGEKKHAQLMVLHSVRGRLSQQTKQKGQRSAPWFPLSHWIKYILEIQNNTVEISRT